MVHICCLDPVKHLNIQKTILSLKNNEKHFVHLIYLFLLNCSAYEGLNKMFYGTF